MKKISKRILYFLFISVLISTINSEAAQWSRIYKMDINKTPVLKGAYSFLMEKKEEAYRLTITSKAKDKPIVIENIASDVLFNDKIVYYAKMKPAMTEVYSMNIKNRKIKRLVSIKEEGLHHVEMEGVAGNHLYFSVERKKKDGFLTNSVYRLHTLNRKLTPLLKDVDRLRFTSQKIFYMDLAMDYAPMKLYGCDLNGKHIQELHPNVLTHKVIGDELYYVGWEQNTGKSYLYCANADASKIVKRSEGFEAQSIIDITSTDVIYSNVENGSDEIVYYKMEIATGKMSKIQDPFR